MLEELNPASSLTDDILGLRITVAKEAAGLKPFVTEFVTDTRFLMRSGATCAGNIPREAN
jgi:hypothetical protein